MWEFPNVRVNDCEDSLTILEESIRRELGAQIQVGAQVGTYQHKYSHFRVNLNVFQCKLLPGSAKLRERYAAKWVALAEIDKYPMGKLDRLVSRQLSKEPR
jgi:A/G-specific adenine glycosylase